MKTCTSCKVEKPLNAYHYNKLGKFQKASHCIECKKLWRAANPKVAKNYHRDEHARKLRTYNISQADYENMVLTQENKCAVCQTSASNTDKGILDIDHCHSSGVVRGLLCGHCNRGIGLMKDNPDILIKAANYLKRTSNIF